jgi:hypothetical protein
MRVFIDYNTDDARRKQRRGVVVVEPLVFVMIVSTKAVTVTKSFFLHAREGGSPLKKQSTRKKQKMNLQKDDMIKGNGF